MKTTFVLFAALVVAPFLLAQEDKPAAPPGPKTKEHGALATFVGDWQCACKVAATPGVAGAEKPWEATGTEKAELVCNGLWVKSTIDSTFQGKPFQGVWLVGYDPFAKSYKSIWVSTQDEGAMRADGSYDEKTRTWTFTGACKEGQMRSVYTLKDADTSVETSFLTGSDGTEKQCMQVTRTRTKGAIPREATSKVTKEVSKTQPIELARLAEGIGSWDAVVVCTIPGQPPTNDKASEVVMPMCDGKWTWSDFRGEFMGAPFEGHGLTGWDSAKKQYVGFWIDSGGPTAAMISGTYDEAKKAMMLNGDCLDPAGKPMSIVQMITQPDANTRNTQMTFKSPQGTTEMKTAYKRAKS